MKTLKVVLLVAATALILLLTPRAAAAQSPCGDLIYQTGINSDGPPGAPDGDCSESLPIIGSFVASALAVGLVFLFAIRSFVLGAPRLGGEARQGVESQGKPATKSGPSRVRDQYKKDAKSLDEGVDTNGHSYADHGAQTDPSDHERRLRTGETRGGSVRNIPETSSRFATHAAHMEAYRRAVAQLGNEYWSTANRMKKEVMVTFAMPGAGFVYSLDPVTGQLVRVNATQVVAIFRLNSRNWYDLVTMFPKP